MCTFLAGGKVFRKYKVPLDILFQYMHNKTVKYFTTIPNTPKEDIYGYFTYTGF